MPDNYVSSKKNVARARRVTPLINRYAKSAGLTAGDGRETWLTDLLVDLMHWAAQRQGVDFDLAIGRAETHFMVEAEGGE